MKHHITVNRTALLSLALVLCACTNHEQDLKSEIVDTQKSDVKAVEKKAASPKASQYRWHQVQLLKLAGLWTLSQLQITQVLLKAMRFALPILSVQQTRLAASAFHHHRTNCLNPQ